MQKLFNVMAVAAFTVTTAQVIAVSYFINNQDKYLNQVREKIIEEVSALVPEIIESSLKGLEVNPPVSTDSELPKGLGF